MYLIPKPTKYKEEEGSFKLKRDTEIVLDYTCDFDDLEAATILQEEIKDLLGMKLSINKIFISRNKKNVITFKRIECEKEAYELEIKDSYINISACSGVGIFYGVQTLRQILRQSGARLQNLRIEDKPYFKNRGFYHDVTRGQVPTLETLKELVDKATFYKINQIQLYIEHTFAFKGMSEVWIDKDPLTAEEILELDRYCKSRHIDLIPSLSTFGHLYEVLRTESFKHLCELEGRDKDEYSFMDRMAHHTLDVSNEESIKLVEDMINKYLPLFSSDTFNICCDETFDLGKGKSKEVADEVGIGRHYLDFLKKVINIVKGHNKKVMFWGDVIVGHPELLSEIDEDVICLNWNYNHEAWDKETKIISETGRIQYVCPGCLGWSQLMNFIERSFENIYRMVSYGVKYGAVGVLNTNWGDYGQINLLANSIPGMAYGASLSWNPLVEREFEETYEALSVIEYGDESKQIVSLLRDLVNPDNVTWSELVVWKERYRENKELMQKLNNLKPETLNKEYSNALEIEEKLTSLASKTRNKVDLQEFIISARGIALVNEFFLVILKNDFDNEEAILKCTENQLAEKFEEWFYDYMNIWRRRNKESELYRLREVIQYACRYLRELDKS